MPDSSAFDEFYASTRTELLWQTYALTGDLPAARSAVRDAYVAAWHHWRKVSRLDDPRAWIRPRAWRHALRRHSARILHRDRSLDGELRATLDALARLPVPQRKVLLLTQTTTVTRPDLAREVGMTQAVAEERLQTATSSFSLHREVPTVAIRPLLDALREHVADERWARVTIIRRAGTTRRRTHTAFGAAVVVGAVLLTGAVVTDAQGVRPSLEAARTTGVAASALGPGAPVGSPSPAAEASQAPDAVIEDDDLLAEQDVRQAMPGPWRQVTEESDSGIVLPCQSTRFADPDGTSSGVRQFRSGRSDQPLRRVSQTAELSASGDGARTAYATMLDWFAGCTDGRVQLLSTYRVDQVGDQAMLMVLRSWDRPETTFLAGVARTGRATTSTVARTSSRAHTAPEAGAQILAGAVNGLCSLPRTGPCAEEPELEETTPVATGEAPGMLGEIDLPPVARIQRPWIGTAPRPSAQNLAASRCDATSFEVPGMRHNRSRTFVIPEAELSDLFGLTETVGRLRDEQAAQDFVTRVRTKLRTCSDREMGTVVVRVADQTDAGHDLTVWHVKTEISDDETITYLMGIVRDGRSVAQVGFVPDGPVQMAPGAFIDLVRRAADRLPELAGG